MEILISILMTLGLMTSAEEGDNEKAVQFYKDNQKKVEEYSTQNSMPIEWDNVDVD
ncbi:MAG: hypothetical protein ACPG4Z_03380 [Chitinophagales bacterium]